MSESSKSSINILIKKTEKLLKRFNEQRGIIDAYIKKEREWKKHKLLQANEIKKLEKVNSKLDKIIKLHEQYRSFRTNHYGQKNFNCLSSKR